MNVNTGGLEQVLTDKLLSEIEELKVELLDLQRDYAKADEKIEELEKIIHNMLYGAH